MFPKIGFILLPGGGMSSWIWDRVKPLLKAEVITPKYRLPENTYLSRTTSLIKDCTDYYISLLDSAHVENVIIAGHSGAGILAASLAKEIPDRVIHLFHISTSIPQNHKSPLASLPFPMRQINAMAIKKQIKTDSTSLSGKEKLIRKYFCNTSSEDVIQFIQSHNLLSEPLCVAFEKCNWDNFPDISQTYIILSKDKTNPVKQQEKMMSHLNITNSIVIDSDHMVMLSNPEKLASVLNSVM